MVVHLELLEISKGSGLAFMLELMSGMLISNNLSFKKNYKDANNCLIICFKK